MNKHILLVMQWLNDKESVSLDELEKSRDEAWADYAADDYAITGNYHAAYTAADTACHHGGADAAYWVDVYFDRTGEDRSEYLKELNK